MLSDVHSRSRNAVGMVNFPTITFDNETAGYNLLARDSLERQLGVHHLYSDGSFNNVDDDANTRMSFAEAYKNVGKTYEPAISGTVLGHASSTRVEIIGILAAILCCPRNHPAKIYCDDVTTVGQFCALIQSPAAASEYLQSRNADWWGMVRKPMSNKAARSLSSGYVGTMPTGGQT